MALALNNLKRVDMPLNKETKLNHYSIHSFLVFVIWVFISFSYISLRLLFCAPKNNKNKNKEKWAIIFHIWLTTYYFFLSKLRLSEFINSLQKMIEFDVTMPFMENSFPMYFIEISNIIVKSFPIHYHRKKSFLIYFYCKCWLVVCVLSHFNLCRLFNAKSSLYTYIKYIYSVENVFWTRLSSLVYSLLNVFKYCYATI